MTEGDRLCVISYKKQIRRVRDEQSGNKGGYDGGRGRKL